MSAIIISAMMATELRHYRPENNLPDVAAQFHVGRQQPRRALRARGCRSAAAGQTTSGKEQWPDSAITN